VVLISRGTSTLPDTSDIREGQSLSQTYGELIRTEPFLQQVVDNLGLDMDPDQLAGKIQFSTREGTNVVELSVTDSDPQRAADIANELVQVFISANTDLQSGRFSGNRERLEAELETLGAELADARLEYDEIQTEVEALQLELSAVEADIDETRTEWETTEELVSSYEQELAFLNQMEEEGYWWITRPRAEEKLKMEFELPGLQQSLGQFEGTLTELEGQKDEIEQQLAEKTAESLPLQRDVNQYESRYAILLDSYEELQLVEASGSNVLSVVEPAEAGQTITQADRRTANAMQAGIAGAVLGLGLVFVADQLNTSVRGRDEIEAIVDVPVVATIADMDKMKANGPLVMLNDPRTPIAESYRMLGTRLDFLCPEVESLTIAVSSSVPLEGKTTTVANLAFALAEKGKRVVIVDADLRRPTLHKVFGKPNRFGLTTVLMSQNGTSLREHIQTTENKNLFVMTSGPLPYNPVDLLQSQRTSRLLELLKKHTDIVLFDTPPVLATADTHIVARMCDTALLVVRSNSTKEAVLREVSAQVRHSGIDLLGVILNRVNPSAQDYYYYHYEGTGLRGNGKR
jgi:capsular exopolysaccharide synthesis family protein